MCNSSADVTSRTTSSRIWWTSSIFPDSLSLQGNPASLEQLQREGLELPEEVTEENFLSWSCVSVEIGEETTVYEFWCAVVKNPEGDCCVGYFEILEAE